MSVNKSNSALVTTSFLFTFVACSADETPKTAQSARAITPPAQTAFGVLASNSVKISDDAIVAAHVGVTDGTASTLGQTLSDGVRLSIGNFANVGQTTSRDIFAYTTHFRFGSDLYRAFIGPTPLADLHDQGTVFTNLFPVMPAFPRARSVYPGTTDLTVTAGSTTTIELASTTYRNIYVADGGVLRVAAGNYQVENVTLERRAAIVALGAVELRVASRFAAAERVRLMVPAQAQSLRIEVLGTNGGARLPGSLPRALDIGSGSSVRAILFAPHGTIGIGASSTVHGALVARDVLVGASAHVTYEDGLLALPGTAPLAFADQYSATEDEPLAIAVEGVLANDLQPSYAPLTASLVTPTHNGTVALSADGSFIYTPNPNFAGDDSFTYRAHNTTEMSAATTVNIHVDALNDVPVFESLPQTHAFVGEQWRYVMQCRDPDLGDVLTYSKSGGPSAISQSGNMLTWVPATAHLGTVELDVRCTDLDGTFDEQRVRVVVQSAPPLDQFVVYASNSVYFRGIAVDGSVGAQGTGAGTFLQEARVTVRGDAIIGQFPGADLFADSVRLLDNSVVQNVYANHILQDRPSARGIHSLMPAVPAFPTTSAVTAGTQALVISVDGTISSTKAWAYYDIRENRCLYLLPGIHQVGDVTLAAHSCIAALGPVDLRISGRLVVGDYGYIGPADGTTFGPELVRIEVTGGNAVMGNMLAKPVAMETKFRSAIQAIVVVPNGTAMFGWASANFGGFYARDIWVYDFATFFKGTEPLPNRSPLIVSTPSLSTNEGAPYSYTVLVQDDANDVEHFTLESAPAGMTIGELSGVLTWTPDQDDAGPHTIRIRVTDAGGLSDTQTFTLTVNDTDTVPVFTVSPPTSVDQNSLYSVQITADHAVSISLVEAPLNMSLSSTGLLTWTPGQADVGAHNVSLAATDGVDVTTYGFVLQVVDVNDPPVFTAGTPPSRAVENQLYNASVRATDIDPADTITYHRASGPSTLTVDASTGAIAWTPSDSEVGERSFDIEARDGHGGVATLHFTVDVEEVNDAPYFETESLPDAHEDQPYSESIVALDPDPSDSVTLTLESGPLGLTLSGTQISWTPSDRQVGTFSISVRAEDEHATTAFATFSITVQNENDAPSFVESDPLTTAIEGHLYRYTARAADPDNNDTLTYTFTGPDLMNIDAATGELTWTPRQQDVGGPHAVVVTVTDAHEATDALSFDIQVGDENDAPDFASNPPLVVIQHHAYVYPTVVLDDSELLTFTFDVAPRGMTVDENGLVEWTPDAYQSGDFDVILRVTDGELFDVQSFTVTVSDENDDPILSAIADQTAAENAQFSYWAYASDVENERITYSLSTRPSGMTIDPGTGLIRWVPRAVHRGANPVVVHATDTRGGDAQRAFIVNVTAAECNPGDLSARCSALAWTNTVNREGVPIDAVEIHEQRGAWSRELLSDLDTGFATLGGGAAGTYEWTFRSPLYVSVYASAELAEQTIQQVPIPRMASWMQLAPALDAAARSYGDLYSYRLSFEAGSISGTSALKVALLDGQTLPAFLPRGWSVVTGVAFDVDTTLVHGPQARLLLPAPLPDNAALVLARYDVPLRSWIAAGAATVNGDYAEATLPSEGSFAILLADQGTGAPPAAVLGDPLQASALDSPELAGLDASGAVDPEWQVASEQVDEITGIAEVAVVAVEDVPSGVILPARLFERYAWSDGQEEEAPSIDLGIALYRYPAAEADPNRKLSALFFVQPRRLFPLSELVDTHQAITLSTALDRASNPIGFSGGSISSGNVQLVVPESAFIRPSLISLSELDTGGLTLVQSQAVLAFRTDWAGELTASSRLELSATVLPNASYVLARRETGAGWAPVERFTSTPFGALQSIESSQAKQLRGVQERGTYALFNVGQHGVVVAGAVLRGSTGLPGAKVTIDGQPWTALSGAGGRYELLSPIGSVRAYAEYAATHDHGEANATTGANGLELDIAVTAEAPRIVRTSPAGAATNARVVTAIEVFFSEPILASSVSEHAITVSGGGDTVVGAQLLRPDRRSIAFLPREPLDYFTDYQVEVAAGLTDDTEVALIEEGRTFTFKTEVRPLRPTGAARLISWTPGSASAPCTGYDHDDPTITCVTGGAGVADAGATVILVNEDSGATQTVTALDNGSFSGFIRGAPEDLLSAVIIRSDGSRLRIPLELQRFDDGSFAVYASGGVITGASPFENGAPFEISIEPGTIARRGVFKLVGKDADHVASIAGPDAEPIDGTVLFGATFSYEGDAMQKPVDVRFPAPASALGETPATAGFVLASVKRSVIGGEELTTYEVLDRMEYEQDALATHSFPMLGLIISFTLAVELELAIIRTAVRPVALTGYVAVCVDQPTSVDGGVGSSCDRVNGDIGVLSGTALSPQILPGVTRTLPGAVVYATRNTQGTGTAFQAAVPSAGQLVSVANGEGRYSLLVPPNSAVSDWSLRAVHNDFGSQHAVASGLRFDPDMRSGLVHLIFRTAAEIVRPPVVSIAHLPLRPEPFVPPSPGDLPQSHQRAEVIVSYGPSHADVWLERASVTSLTSEAAAINIRRLTAADAHQSPARFEVTSTESAIVQVRARVALPGSSASSVHTIAFGADDEVSVNDPPPSEPNDHIGPMVISTRPTHGGLYMPGTPIVIEFSEAISRAILNNSSPVSVDTAPENVTFTLSEDQRRLSVTLSNVEPGTKTLRIASPLVASATYPLRDLSNNSFDQDRFVDGESFELELRVAASAMSAALGDLRQPGGAVLNGRYAYVIDRLGGMLEVFDMIDPLHPQHLTRWSVVIDGGYPRDIVLIPNYSYIRPYDPRPPLDPNDRRPSNQIPCGPDTAYWEQPSPLGCLSLNRTMVAVVGGIGGYTLSADRTTGQWLDVFDITDGPTAINKVFGHPIANDTTTTLGELVWSAPDLAYMRRSTGAPVVELVDLQELIYGRAMSPRQLDELPSSARTPGVQANDDGDYVDPGESLPLPGRPTSSLSNLVFPGLYNSLGARDTTQPFFAYAFHGQKKYLAGILGQGTLSTDPSTLIPPTFRTFLTNNAEPTRVDGSYFQFGTQDPAAPIFLETIAYFPNIEIRLRELAQQTQLEAGTVERIDLAIVGARTSFVPEQPDPPDPQNPPPPPPAINESRLYLFNVSSGTPVPIGDPFGLVLPRSSGVIEKVERHPLLSNVLRINTENDLLMLDIDRLTMSSASDQHPSLMRTVPGIGSSYSANGATAYGVHLLADTREAAFTGPEMFLVSFGASSPNPVMLHGNDDRIGEMLSEVLVVEDLRPARIRAQGALPANHSTAQLNYRVLVFAPGQSTATIPLRLESLNEASYPLGELGPGFAPTQVVLDAHRLSDVPANANYNVYLSDPFVLVYQHVESAPDLAALQTLSGQPRKVLHSGASVRASIDASVDRSLLTPYANRVVNGRIELGKSVSATTFAAPRILGAEHPAIAGGMSAPGTDGMVSFNNRELRFGATDMTLPSPQLPFAFHRVYTGQDLVGAGFGPGFDFNYNQRIVELSPANIDTGDDVALVIRGANGSGDRIARSRDLLLHTGSGTIIHYRRLSSTDAASNYTGDPLFPSALAQNVRDWYAPETGVFDGLVRTNDGAFLRITPSGTKYFYNARGRLHRILHRYEGNEQLLTYTTRGELRRIEDRSATERRFIQLSYYRANGDELLQSTQPGVADDEMTSQGAYLGRISRIRDHLGREVIYRYDSTGRIERIEGIDVGATQAGGAAGRRMTEYFWEPNSHLIHSIRDGANAGELTFTATLNGARVTETRGRFGTTTLDPPGTNDRSVLLDDGTRVTASFDAFAMPRSIAYNKGGTTETTHYEYYDRYRVQEVTFPLGNSAHYAYAEMANLRSRGNVVRTEQHTSGEDPLTTQTPDFNPSFNFVQGTRIDAAGREQIFTVADGAKDVTSISYGAGIEETFGFDSATGQMTSHRTIDGTSSTWTYDSATRFPSLVQSGTLQTTFSYNTCGRGGRLGRACNVTRGPEVESFEYNDLGEQIRAVKGSFEQQIGYDLNGYPRHIQSGPVGFQVAEYAEDRSYDAHGFMETRTIQRAEVNDNFGSLQWTYARAPMNRVLSVTSAGTVMQEYTYDLRGRVAQTNIGEQVRSFSYDLNGNLDVVRAGPAGAIVLEDRNYDGFDRLSLVTSANGGETELRYTKNGDLRRATTRDRFGTLSEYNIADPETGIDGAGRPTTWSQDGVSFEAAYSIGQTGGTRATTVGNSFTHTNTWDVAGLTRRDEIPGVYRSEPEWHASLPRLQGVAQIENGADFGTGFRYQNESGFLEGIEDSAGERAVRYTNRYDGLATGAAIAPDAAGFDLQSTLHRSVLGESLGATGPVPGPGQDAIANVVQLDRDRRLHLEGPPSNGRTHEYDASSRVSRTNYPNAGEAVYSSFDSLGNPRNVLLPNGGGSISADYDDAGRLHQRTVSVPGQPAFTETFDYDALDRLRRATTPISSVDFDYSPGFLRNETRLRIDGQPYNVRVDLDHLRAPQTTTYPNGQAVHSLRDFAGRLSTLTVDGAPLATVNSYAMASAPGTMTIGADLQRIDRFDHRRRLISRSYVHPSSGDEVAGFRYAYDAADRETVRQYQHEGGRADLFDYDRASRLLRADYGARPALPDEGDGHWPVATGWRPGDYGRGYDYDDHGNDRIEHIGTDVHAGESAIDVGADFADYDASGFAQTVDGVTREIDALGNVTQLELPTGVATLRYDGLSRLTRIERADGAIITYDYRADGPLAKRTVQCGAAPGCTSTERTFVYDGLRLLQEYETSGAQPLLMAQYFYADEGEIPLAADLRATPQDSLARRFFVTDRQGSIHGVLDEAGEWIERIHYDGWGRPNIELADTTPPAISEVLVESSGSILVAFTEPVLPPLAANTNPTVTTALGNINNALQIVFGGTQITGTTVELLSSVTGFDRDTVVRIHLPLGALAANDTFTLQLAQDGVRDRWSNGTEADALDLTFNPPTPPDTTETIYTGPAQGTTSPIPTPRSTTGNAVLFQSHLYDNEAGLIHMRARIFDPRTGTFLQRDPYGYEDSVNLYAGLANDAVNNRDPTGETIKDPWCLKVIQDACMTGCRGTWFGLADAACYNACVPIQSALEESSDMQGFGGFICSGQQKKETPTKPRADEKFGPRTTEHDRPRPPAELDSWPQTPAKKNETPSKIGRGDGPVPAPGGHWVEADPRTLEPLKKLKKAGLAKAKDDIPDIGRGEVPYAGESGRDFAERILRKYNRFDPSDTGPRSDFNRLKKYADHTFENPPVKK